MGIATLGTWPTKNKLEATCKGDDLLSLSFGNLCLLHPPLTHLENANLTQYLLFGPLCHIWEQCEHTQAWISYCQFQFDLHDRHAGSS